MHQVEGDAVREATAFLSSCLSFGSRSQFMPKIQSLVDMAGGDVDGWIRRGGFENAALCGNRGCFYRFYTCSDLYAFLCRYREVMDRFGSLGAYVRASASTGLDAVKAVCAAFGSTKLVPADAKSACKRVCMFLRWMVRTPSPVDLGLWSGFIDRRTLVMPLDVHVLRQSRRLGLMQCANASMAAAVRLTKTLAEVFPDDPLKGDFALFGYGANNAVSSEGGGAQ